METTVEFGDITAAADSARQRREIPSDIATGPVADLQFADAPPAFARERGGQRISRWAPVLNTLQANPGQWAKIGTFASATNRPKLLKDAGIKFRVISRTEHSHLTGTTVVLFDLWACYPAPF